LQNPYKPGAVYAGTTEGFWMSANGGRSWSLTTSRKLEINAIAVHPSNPDKIYIATNNYGVMVSTNGGRSFGANNGNFSSRFTYNITPDIETIAYSLVQDLANPNLIYLATNFGLYKSPNRGVTWNKISAPKPKRRRSKRRRSRRSRAKAIPKLPKGTVAALSSKINMLVHTQDGKNGYLAATNKGLFRSYDIAKGWKKIDFGPGLSEQVFAVHVSAKAPETVWVGTAISGVIVSRDNGMTWERVGKGIIPDRIPVSTVVTNPENPNNVFVGTIQTLYVSKDGGRTWDRRGGNLPLGNYNSILINPNNPDEMFVASAMESNGGIFHSTDAGWNWKRIDKAGNLASSRVWSLMFNPSNQNELLAATHSSGIYRIGRTQEAKVKPPEAIVKPKTDTALGNTRTRIVGSN
jgi:photosystem II stability/assembly factor-like uncharacterized protein